MKKKDQGAKNSVSPVQSLSRVWLFATPWTAACQDSLSITNSQSLLKLMSTESVMPSNHFILCHPLLLLPSIFPRIRVFSSKLVLCIRWPKYWSFSISISPSNEYSGLNSFRIDWFDLLAVQGTLKSLLQHHSPKASFLWHLAFFMVTSNSHIHTWLLEKPSFDYMDLCRQSDISVFNMLSKFVIGFLPLNKCLLISWLQLPSAEIMDSEKTGLKQFVLFSCFFMY